MQTSPEGDTPTVRVRGEVAYDGTDFRGFALQPQVPTVAGALLDAIERVTGERPFLTCAGRTDAGVHARAQVVSFDLPSDALDLDGLRRRVNKLCGPAVVVRDLRVAPPGFDARHDATGRSYRYRVLNSEVPDPFRSRFVWQVPEPLDLRAMVAACDPLIGEHDFSSFCRAPKVPEGQPPASLRRRVRRATWVDAGDDVVELHIEASAFCHQMVRSIVGTLVEVGRGKRDVAGVKAVLEARDRSTAGQMAPAAGLCLWEVTYAER